MRQPITAVIIAGFLASLSAYRPPGLSAQTVIWTTRDPGKGAAMAAVGLLDQILAENERLRQTPMVHRRTGLRPAVGEEVLVRPGEVVVARIQYEVAYMARPRADFVNTRGVRVSADSLRTFLMLNNKYCITGGDGRCFEDKDRNHTWDGAGQENGRRVDVPFEVIEIRKEVDDGDRRELVLAPGTSSPSLEYREYVAGSVAIKNACIPVDGVYRCGGMAVKSLGSQGDGQRFQVLPLPSTPAQPRPAPVP